MIVTPPQAATSRAFTGHGAPRPFTMAMVPGEALDTWLERCAATLRTPSPELLKTLGLQGTARSLMSQHTSDELAVLAAFAGAAPDDLRAATLSGYEGYMISNQHDSTARRNWWRRRGSSRWCPSCLRETGGAWQLWWRFPFAFACGVHRVLLEDICASCGMDGLPLTQMRDDWLDTTRCHRRMPGTGSCRQRCGADLMGAADLIPAAPEVLRAQQHMNLLWAAMREHAQERSAPQGPGAWLPEPGAHMTSAAANGALRDVIRLTQGRLLRLRSDPPDELRHVWQQLNLTDDDIARTGMRSAATAAASVLYVAALDETRGEPLHLSQRRTSIAGWLLRKDATTSRLHPRVIEGSPETFETHLRAVRNLELARQRLQQCGRAPHDFGVKRDGAHRDYRPASAREQRLARLPLAMWPQWAVLLDERTAHKRGQARVNTELVSCLDYQAPDAPLACSLCHARLNKYATTDPGRTITIAAALARYLDEHGSPIDYTRRRALFHDALPDLDDKAVTAAAEAADYTFGIALPVKVSLQFLLWKALTGSDVHLRPEALQLDSLRHDFLSRIELRLPTAFHALVHTTGQAIVAEHGLDEPLTWAPTLDDVQKYLPEDAHPLALPSHDELLRGVSTREHRTDDRHHITARLLILGVRQQAVQAGDDVPLLLETQVGTGLSRWRRGVAPPHRVHPDWPDMLRQRYETRGVTVRKIAAEFDVPREYIHSQLRILNIPRRHPGRPRRFDRTNLHERYVELHQTRAEIAEGLGVCRNTVSEALRSMGVSHHRGLPATLARLGLSHLAPENIRTDQGALEGLIIAVKLLEQTQSGHPIAQIEPLPSRAEKATAHWTKRCGAELRTKQQGRWTVTAEGKNFLRWARPLRDALVSDLNSRQSSAMTVTQQGQD